MCEFKPSFTCAIISGSGDSGLWRLAEEYLNITDERYQVSGHKGQQYSLRPPDGTKQRWWVKGLKVLSYVIPVFALLLALPALAVRSHYRKRRIFTISTNTSCAGNLPSPLSQQQKSTGDGDRAKAVHTQIPPAQIAASSPVASGAGPIPQELNRIIIASASAPSAISRNPSVQGIAYICGENDDWFQTVFAKHLYPHDETPPLVTDDKGDAFSITPGDDVIKIFFSNIQGGAQEVQRIATEGILLPGRLVRHLHKGDTIAFKYAGILCKTTIDQEDFAEYIEMIEEALYPGGRGESGSPVSDPREAKPKKQFEAPSVREARQMAEAARTTISIGNTDGAKEFMFEEGGFSPHEAPSVQTIPNVGPLRYEVQKDRRIIRIAIPGCTRFLLRIKGNRLTVYRHLPPAPGTHTTTIPEHAAACIDLAQFGIDPLSIEQHLAQASLQTGILELRYQ